MQDVLAFWFRTLEPSDRFKKSDELDARITAHFESTYHQAVAGETSHWRDTAEGRLAEIIVLDQLARNMFRNTPMAFTADPLALALAQEAIRCDDHLKLGLLLYCSFPPVYRFNGGGDIDAGRQFFVHQFVCDLESGGSIRDSTKNH